MFAIKISRNTYWFKVFTLILHKQSLECNYNRNGLDNRIFHVSCQQPSLHVDWKIIYDQDSVGWISKTYLPFSSFSKLTLFRKYFMFLNWKRAKTRSHAISNNTFPSAIWNVLHENKFMLLARFEQATIWLVVIDNSKRMRAAVCLGEERGLISRTASGNRAYPETCGRTGEATGVAENIQQAEQKNIRRQKGNGF